MNLLNTLIKKNLKYHYSNTINDKSDSNSLVINTYNYNIIVMI